MNEIFPITPKIPSQAFIIFKCCVGKTTNIGKAIAANVTDKNSSIIVGPGQNLLVYSSAGDLSYQANGFETSSDDYEVVNMTKIATGG